MSSGWRTRGVFCGRRRRGFALERAAATGGHTKTEGPSATRPAINIGFSAISSFRSLLDDLPWSYRQNWLTKTICRWRPVHEKTVLPWWFPSKAISLTNNSQVPTVPFLETFRSFSKCYRWSPVSQILAIISALTKKIAGRAVLYKKYLVSKRFCSQRLDILLKMKWK